MTDLTPASEVTEEELERQIPTPVGYRVLVAMPEVEDTYGDSGIIKSSKEIHHDYIMSTIGVVLDMGEQAYSDKERFTTGPWCKVGDVEYRLMNDDSIEAVVNDPRGVTRV